MDLTRNNYAEQQLGDNALANSVRRIHAGYEGKGQNIDTRQRERERERESIGGKSGAR